MRKFLHTKNFWFHCWVGIAYLVLLFAINIVTYPDSFLVRTLNDFWLIALITTFNLILFELVIPYLKVSWDRLILGALLLLLFLLLYSVGVYAWRQFGISLGVFTPLSLNNTRAHLISYCFAYSVGGILLTALINHFYSFNRLKQLTQQLRIEKQQAELNFLKSQTNPHFLFNTLNNIYALSKDKSDLAPESVLRLSKILRFMLYETNEGKISIDEEIKVIQDYIALEQLRYDSSLRVVFNREVSDERVIVPPLLLVPLVENAFKHGVSEVSGDVFIEIDLKANQHELVFNIRNSVKPTSAEELKGNIGMANLRRQLEMLYKDFSLVVIPGSSVFSVELKINLNSHA